MDNYRNKNRKKKQRRAVLRLALFVLCSCLCIAFWIVKIFFGKTAIDELPAAESVPSPVPTMQVAATTPVPAPAPVGSGYRFFESSLSGAEYDLYISCRNAIADLRPSVPFKMPDYHRAMDIAQQIHYDYPEYFWFTGDVSVNYQVLGNSYAGDLSFSYSCDPAAMAAGKKDLENASAEILSSLSGESEYEKVKGVYEYLINNSSYDINVKDQTSYSLLVNRSGVCAGYAGAMKYLLDRLNVDCMIASGKSKGEDHVWNLVRIGGCWYQVDPTWGDPVTGSDFQTISYDYLLLDDEEMFLDHQYDSGVVYPNCSTEESNFYRREGLYLESCDYTELSGMMKSCIENGRDFIFKCADTNLYFEVCNYLFEREQIFSLLRDFGYDIDSINYSTDEMHRTIKIVLAR